MTIPELGHFIGGASRPGTSGRARPVFDPATGGTNGVGRVGFR